MPTDTARDADLETLCDLGAAELLFPRTTFLDDLAGNAITLDLVDQLANRYDASLEATARRVVALNPQPTLLPPWSRHASPPSHSPNPHCGSNGGGLFKTPF